MAKDDRVLIVGMGYVGLPLALSFVRGGLHVLGLDIDQSKVDALNTGTSYLGHIADNDIAQAVATGRFDATTDFARCSEVDAVIIAVLVGTCFGASACFSGVIRRAVSRLTRLAV